MTALLIGAGVMGAVVGSFLNVVAWRLPRGESLVRPGSRCPRCETPIRPWHNVPVFGWLVLRGRCADCSAPIPVRYPLVEAATAALYVVVVAATGADRDAVLGLLLVSALVPLALIDLEHRKLPNVITCPPTTQACVPSSPARRRSPRSPPSRSCGRRTCPAISWPVRSPAARCSSS